MALPDTNPHQPTATSTPPLVCVDDYAEAASSIIPKMALDFYVSGAMAQTTVRENRTAMDR